MATEKLENEIGKVKRLKKHQNIFDREEKKRVFKYLEKKGFIYS